MIGRDDLVGDLEAALVAELLEEAPGELLVLAGAYLVFRQKAGGPWKAWNAGIPGSSGFTCAVTPPGSVLAVWDWAPGACHPRSSD